MASIWAIEYGDYSDYRIIGVFSSYERAALMLAEVASECYTPAIVEWPIDPAITELQQGLHLFHVGMCEDGTVETYEAMCARVPGDLLGNCAIIRRSRWREIPARGDLLLATVWARDETHAIKITNEHRTRLIATGEWAGEGVHHANH